MKLVSDLLTPEEMARYKRISKLNMRSSIYDLTNKCNLRCQGCFFYSSDSDKVGQEVRDLDGWSSFVDKELDRGVNLAILIGGEPTLYLDRVEVFYKRMNTFVATNGIVKVPRDRFPDVMVGISVWGDRETEVRLRGKDVFAKAAENYAGDDHAYVLLTVTCKQLGAIHKTVEQVRDIGLKVHLQIYSNDENAPGYDWTPETLKAVREELDDLLDCYPDTVISSKYYHQVLTTQEMLGRRWGWMECPSVSVTHDTRNPQPRRLINFNHWASDLQSTHRCCTSSTRDCDLCHDGAATMSWIMVNKREHMNTREDFLNWLEVYEMFAKLYRFIPWS